MTWTSGRVNSGGVGGGGHEVGQKGSLPTSASVVTTISNRYTTISQLQFNTNGF